MLITLRKKITFLDECSYLKRLNILKSVISIKIHNISPSLKAPY